MIPVVLVFGAALFAGPALGALTPSTELAFRAVVRPDSISVGDPITLTLEGSAPEGATLLLPTPADSIGPFTVLSADPPITETKDGRLHLRRTVRLTLFRAGGAQLPGLPLLSPRRENADTLVAWSQPVSVQVGTVLQGKLDPSSLKELKKPVPLSRPRWWLWALIAATAVAAAWALRSWLRRRRRLARGQSAAPAPPPLPPEIAFEQGLAALRAERLPERGLIREYYFELSMLFRRYLEDRFAFAAVEETRSEILARAADLPELRREEIRGLSLWLDEGDLVKFARMDRLLQEAEAYTDRAVAWVRATTAPRVPPTPDAAPAAGGSRP